MRLILVFIVALFVTVQGIGQVIAIGVKGDAGTVVTTYGTNEILADNNWSNEWQGSVGVVIYKPVLGLNNLQVSSGVSLGMSNFRLRSGWNLPNDILTPTQSPLNSYSVYRVVRKNTQLVIPFDIRMKLISARGFFANHNFYITGGLVWRINVSNTENIYSVEQLGNYESTTYQASEEFKSNLNSYFENEFAAQNLMAAIGFERGRALSGIELIYSVKYQWHLSSMTKDLKINNSGGLQFGVGIRFGGPR
jgi:hypothetical protein